MSALLPARSFGSQSLMVASEDPEKSRGTVAAFGEAQASKRRQVTGPRWPRMNPTRSPFPRRRRHRRTSPPSVPLYTARPSEDTRALPFSPPSRPPPVGEDEGEELRKLPTLAFTAPRRAAPPPGR